MPFSLRHLSIRAQLILAIVLATAVACVVAAGLSLVREVNAYADNKRIEMRAMAGLIAVISSDAVKAGDRGLVHDAIGAMKNMPGVVYVRVSDLNGTIMAEHGFGSSLVTSGDGLDFASLLAGRPASTTMSIIKRGETIGQVEMLTTTAEFRGRIVSLLMNTAMATVLALVLGVMTAHLLQRRVAGRIREVAQAMTLVQRTHRYDLTLPDDRRDEIGTLTQGFNRMMGEIRVRDDRLAEHRANLEQEVEHRTYDLKLAKEAADDANAAKSEFLATMSHEIRTPLNGLMVMAELLAAAELHPRERRYADVVVRSGGNLLAIINDVLDYSKIEAGKIDLEAIELDLSNVIDDVTQLFASKAAAQSLDLAAFTHPAICKVVGDPVRLGQIVSNLVNNAIKFTPSGHVMIEATPDPARIGHVLIRVTDTGIGIPTEKLAKVFESFSQADQSTARQYGGTGLGLSICQRLVAVMGGEIGVESTEGKGSCFWFSVPLAAASAEAASIPMFSARMAPGASANTLDCYAAVGSAMGGADVVIVDPMSNDAQQFIRAHASGSRVVVVSRVGDAAAEQWIADGRAAGQLSWPVRRSELIELVRAVASGQVQTISNRSKSVAGKQYAEARVLIVDDGAVNREVAMEALKRFGIVADTAVDGTSALHKVEIAPYDLILMDGSMPGMDGFETSRQIRMIERSRGMAAQRIVALTAHAIGSGADAWRDAGMDGLLLKPFSMAQMEACLAQHLVESESKELQSVNDVAEAEAAPSMIDSELLDPDTVATLAMLAEASAESVQRILHIFMEHAPPALERLAATIETEASENVASAAHALKSMAMSVGAKTLATALGELENNARDDGQLPSANDIDRVRQLLMTSITALLALPWMAPAQNHTSEFPSDWRQLANPRGK